MRNKISNKIIASLMLTALLFSNSMLAVSAMENVGVVQYGSTNKPALRDEGDY